jgi:hypothetical protein
VLIKYVSVENVGEDVANVAAPTTTVYEVPGTTLMLFL